MPALATTTLTPRIPLSIGDKVLQTFRFTTGTKEVACDEWIQTMFDSVTCVIGVLAKGPGTAPVAATMTGTFTGAATAGDTITIGGIIYTARAAPGTEAYTFDIGASVTLSAVALCDAINNTSGGTQGVPAVAGMMLAHPDVIATSALGVVTFTARRPGVSGNSIVISESCDNYTDSAAQMSGGTGQDRGIRAYTVHTYTDVNVAEETVTIDGVVYTHKAAPGTGVNHVDEAAATQEDASEALAYAINFAGTAGKFGTGGYPHPTVFAQWNPATATVQIWARKFGCAGNLLATTETDTNGSFTAGVLAGGVGGVTIPDIEVQLNARGTGVAEGTNVGDIGVACSEAGWEIEITVLGEATAG